MSAGGRTAGLTLAVLVLAAAPRPAEAKGGLYLQLGVGGATVDGQFVADDRIQGLSLSGINGLTTDVGDGVAGLFRLGFNVLGYAALELDVSAHGHNLESEWRSWSGQGHVALRVYPLWHWQRHLGRLLPALENLEPSIALGWGLAYQVYKPPRPPPATDSVEVGWRTLDCWRLGFGLEYFVFDALTVGFEYDWIHTPYDTFLFNFEDDIRGPLSDDAVTNYHHVYVTVGFHVDFLPDIRPALDEPVPVVEAGAAEPEAAPADGAPADPPTDPAPAAPAEPATGGVIDL